MKIKKQKVVSVCMIALLSFSLVGCGGEKSSDGQSDASATASHQTVRDSSDPEIIKEDKPDFNEDATYRNDRTVSYDYGSGTITVGLSGGPTSDYIYLNPHCSQASSNNRVGYYLESSRVDLEYSTEGAGVGPGIAFNERQTDLVIVDRLYSDVIPAKYSNESDYGVRWSDDYMKDGTNGGTTIAIRAVSLDTNTLIALCEVSIVYDAESNSYYIDSIKSSEVVGNRELDEESRNNLVSKAASFAGERLHVDVSDFDTSRAIVDKHNGTYFSKFLDEDDSVLYYKDYTTCADTYVVNLPSASYGYISVYFAPQTQLIGLTSPTEPGKTDMKLKLYGYDPVRPQDTNTIIVPDGFFS